MQLNSFDIWAIFNKKSFVIIKLTSKFGYHILIKNI